MPRTHVLLFISYLFIESSFSAKGSQSSSDSSAIDPLDTGKVIDELVQSTARPFYPEVDSRVTFETVCNQPVLQESLDWFTEDIFHDYITDPLHTGPQLGQLSIKKVSTTREALGKYLGVLADYNGEGLELMAFSLMTTRVYALLAHAVRLVQLPVDTYAGTGPVALKAYSQFYTQISTTILNYELIERTSENFLTELLVVWEDCRVLEGIEYIPSPDDVLDWTPDEPEPDPKKIEEVNPIPIDDRKITPVNPNIKPNVKKDDPVLLPQKKENQGVLTDDPRKVEIKLVPTKDVTKTPSKTPTKKPAGKVAMTKDKAAQTKYGRTPNYMAPTISSLHKAKDAIGEVYRYGLPVHVENGRPNWVTKNFVHNHPKVAAEFNIEVGTRETKSSTKTSTTTKSKTQTSTTYYQKRQEKYNYEQVAKQAQESLYTKKSSSSQPKKEPQAKADLYRLGTNNGAKNAGVTSGDSKTTGTKNLTPNTKTQATEVSVVKADLNSGAKKTSGTDKNTVPTTKKPLNIADRPKWNPYNRRRRLSQESSQEEENKCGKTINDLVLYHQNTLAWRYKTSTQEASQAQATPAVAEKRLEHFNLILDLHKRMCVFLQTIVMAAAGQQGPVFNKVSEVMGDKDMASSDSPLRFLSAFYRHFFYILTDYRPETCEVNGAKSIRAAVSIALTGKNIDDPQVFRNRKFFSATFFSLVSNSKSHLEIIEYDKLIILGLAGRADLNFVRSFASKKIMIHLDFLNQLNQVYQVQDDSIDIQPNESVLADLLEIRSHPQPESEAVDTYRFSYYALVYKIYVYLRATKAESLKADFGRVAVFKVIMAWLLDPDNFLPTAPIYGNFVSFHEMSYFYPAMFSFVCIQTNCKNDFKLDETVKKILLNLQIYADFRPSSHGSVYILPQFQTFFKAAVNPPQASSFAAELAALPWEQVLSNCPRQEMPLPVSETGALYLDRTQTIISFTSQCIAVETSNKVTILQSFVGLLTKYLGVKVGDKDVQLSYFRLRHFMDSNSNIHIRGLSDFLFRAYLRSGDPSSVSKTLSTYFLTNFYRDRLAERVTSVTTESSFGLFQFFSDLILPDPKARIAHIFRLLPGQDEFFYRDLFFLIHLPSKDPKRAGPTTSIGTDQQNKVKEIIEKLFENAPVEKQVKLAEFINRAGQPALHLEYLSSVRLLVDHLPFFNFCNNYHEYGKQFNARNLPYPYQLMATFYTFLYKVRKNVDSAITDPFRYTLRRLEDCMRFSSLEINAMPELASLCNLSYRRYAELYFVYKTFLMMEKGFDDLTYEIPIPAFPVVRSSPFFYLVAVLPSWAMHLDRECKRPLADTSDFCQVSRMVLDLARGLENNLKKRPTFADLTRKFDYYFQLDSSADTMNPGLATVTKIKVLTLFDAFHGLMKVNPLANDSFLGLLDPTKTGIAPEQTASETHRIWQLEPNPDANDLIAVAKYLQLAYRKRFIEPKQECLQKTVQDIFSICRAGATSLSQDQKGLDQIGLHDFLTHQGVHSVGLLRIFLSYGNSIQDYFLIAEYLAQNGLFLEIINIENERQDHMVEEVTAEMMQKCASTSDRKALVSHLRAIIKSKLELTVATSLAQVESNLDLSGEDFQKSRVSAKDLLYSSLNKIVQESIKQDEVVQTTIDKRLTIGKSTDKVSSELFLPEVTEEYQNTAKPRKDPPLPKIWTYSMTGETREIDANKRFAEVSVDSKQFIWKTLSFLDSFTADASKTTEKVSGVQETEGKKSSYLFQVASRFSLQSSQTELNKKLSSKLEMVSEVVETRYEVVETRKIVHVGTYFINHDLVTSQPMKLAVRRINL